ncbi:hypothetical protein K469DRAFT_765799 [Zopfia rhizophila CBS 207.26]|uniref:Uncharacterized protein n=1 Tax=Zopfia rhizophila CBS 207.26 TaxID=1314779 RepID=A0A6A6EFA4_9PEZI|nr:hypothetical protein K469DRAFT_765799 [Zopfia rhizophila CBS 207.26]
MAADIALTNLSFEVNIIMQSHASGGYESHLFLESTNFRCANCSKVNGLEHESDSTLSLGRITVSRLTTTSNTKFRPSPFTTLITLPIFQVNSQIRREAHQSLYSNLTWYFEDPGVASPPSTITRFLNYNEEYTFTHIRTVALKIFMPIQLWQNEKVNTHFEGIYLTVFRGIARCRKLRSLELMVEEALFYDQPTPSYPWYCDRTGFDWELEDLPDPIPSTWLWPYHPLRRIEGLQNVTVQPSCRYHPPDRNWCPSGLTEIRMAAVSPSTRSPRKYYSAMEGYQHKSQRIRKIWPSRLSPLYRNENTSIYILIRARLASNNFKIATN